MSAPVADPVGTRDPLGSAPAREPERQAAAESPGPGAMLARGRAARGLKISDVAARLKFAPRQIEALEADEYARLPGMTFVRGMIRNYAKLLSLDAASLLDALDRRHAPVPVSVEMHSESVPFPDGRTRSTRVYLALSGVLIVIVGALLYEWQFGMPQLLNAPPAPPAKQAPAPPPPARTEVAPAQVPPSETAVPALAPAAAREAGRPAASADAAREAARARGALVFEFERESWVQVRDREGRVLMSQLNAAGSRRTLEGEAPFSIVVGNAPHVRLTYNDAPVDLNPHIKLDVARLTLN